MINWFKNLFKYTGPIPKVGQVWDFPRKMHDNPLRSPIEYTVVQVSQDGSWFRVQHSKTQDLIDFKVSKWVPLMRLKKDVE